MGISIIMPACNAAPTIADAVRSVLAQSLMDWELIIIDDASTDDTVAIARSFTDPRIHLLRHDERQGAAAARNTGTRMARYEWLNYLDADDRLTPSALQGLVRASLAQPQAGVIYANYVRIRADGTRYGTRRYTGLLPRPSGNVLRPFLVQNRMVNGGLALVKKSLVEQVGGWNESLRTSSDWALWTLLACQTDFYHVPGLIALEYRELPTGLTQSENTAFEKALPAIDYVYSHPLITARIAAGELVKLRARKEAQTFALLAAQKLRNRQLKPALTHLQASLRRSWRHSPHALTQFALAGIDGWL